MHSVGYVCIPLECCFPYHLQRYPDEEVPQFKPVMSELYEECLFLSRKLMEMMGYALKLNVSINQQAP